MKRKPIFLILTLIICISSPVFGQHNLRPKSYQEGDIVRKKTQFTISNGRVFLQSNGKVLATGQQTLNGTTLEELEIIGVDNNKPTEIHQSILSDVTKSQVMINNEEKNETTNGLFSGQTIAIKKVGGFWQKKLLGNEPTGAQEAELQSPFTLDEELYPEKNLSKGETWQLTGGKLSALMGAMNFLSLDGKADFTLEDIAEVDGEKCAMIIFRLDLNGTTIDGSGVETLVTIGGNGKIRRSLEKGIDISTDLNGVLKFQLQTLQDQTPIDITISGPFHIQEVQTKR